MRVDDLARYAGEDPSRARAGARDAGCGSDPSPRPWRSGGPPRYEIFHDVLAPAVLAWRARHEAERALERERAAARRRHRRVALVAAVALVALAGTSALAVWALSQRAEAREQAARRGRGCALSRRRASSRRTRLVQLGRDPELGLAARGAGGATRARRARRRTCSGALCASRGSARSRSSARLSATSPRCRGARCRGRGATAACGSSKGTRPGRVRRAAAAAALRRWFVGRARADRQRRDADSRARLPMARRSYCPCAFRTTRASRPSGPGLEPVRRRRAGAGQA